MCIAITFNIKFYCFIFCGSVWKIHIASMWPSIHKSFIYLLVPYLLIHSIVSIGRVSDMETCSIHSTTVGLDWTDFRDNLQDSLSESRRNQLLRTGAQTVVKPLSRRSQVCRGSRWNANLFTASQCLISFFCSFD